MGQQPAAQIVEEGGRWRFTTCVSLMAIEGQLVSRLLTKF